MKKILSFCLFLAAASLNAGHVVEKDFNSELITINGSNVCVVSSFEKVDYITSFTFEGNANWELNFNSKIISWKKEKDILFVFSQHRNRLTYYLTSVNLVDGSISWEKSVYAPSDPDLLPPVIDPVMP